MRFLFIKIVGLLFISFSIHFTTVKACSTFKLQKGNQLIYGHNLNQGDIGVPGLIFINKRGIFKTGRTWDEIATKEKKNPSNLCWVSRYGSVTFNNFGKDFPDGGMNEAGLYIWEMNAETEYPKCDSLPKLNQMHWMQYILDNCTTLNEAIDCAHNITIDGWGWHFFVGDSKGNTAAIEFIDGRVIVHSGKNMPIPALFNSYYDREMEMLKYYKGFGGIYEPELNSPKVARFVKTAILIDKFNEDQNAVDYGFEMLNTIRVDDIPEWSVVFDVINRTVYFRTRLNPEIKSFSMEEIDFSNASPVKILNMDIKQGGNVKKKFIEYSNQEMKEFLTTFVIPVLPEKFFTQGGNSIDEFLTRISEHTDKAELKDSQYFKGTWSSTASSPQDLILYLQLKTDGANVSGILWNSKNPDRFTVDHIELINNKLTATFRTKGKTLVQIKGEFNGDELVLSLTKLRNEMGEFLLHKNDGEL